MLERNVHLPVALKVELMCFDIIAQMRKKNPPGIFVKCKVVTFENSARSTTNGGVITPALHERTQCSKVS